jgi:hypothetical protein
MQVQNVSFMGFRGPKALKDRHQKTGACAGRPFTKVVHQREGPSRKALSVTTCWRSQI